jgi:outer membrane protein TolC
VEIERGIESDLRDAIRRYENGSARLELAREGVDAANEQVRIGLIEFENGRSTAFELVRLAADLASAQQELSRALVRTATARTDLYRLVGPSAGSHSEAVGGNR